MPPPVSTDGGINSAGCCCGAAGTLKVGSRREIRVQRASGPLHEHEQKNLRKRVAGWARGLARKTAYACTALLQTGIQKPTRQKLEWGQCNGDHQLIFMIEMDLGHFQR